MVTTLEGLVGSPHCTKQLIEEEPFERERNLLSDAGRLVLFDTTSICFERQVGKGIAQQG